MPYLIPLRLTLHRMVVRAAVRFRNAILLVVLSGLPAAALEPPVEGDQNLFALVLDAQRHNLAQVGSSARGEIAVRAIRRSKSPTGHETTLTLNMRQVWSGPLVFWEYDIKSVDNSDRVQPGPTYIRLLFDGAAYTVYRPLESGGVTICDTSDVHNVAPLYEDLDHRPAIRWSTHHGTRPWEQLLGPHPRFPQDGIRKWVVHQDGSAITMERFDSADGAHAGKARFVASLDFSGHVIEADYKGKGQRHMSKYEWAKATSGVVLDREWKWSQYADGTLVEKEFKVLSFDPNPGNVLELGLSGKDAALEKAIRIRKGTRVEDKIRKKIYTYGGAQITEEMLKDLGKTIQAKGFSRPK